MRISESAVKRPVLTTMFFLGILLLGAFSFTRLQVDLLPEIDFPSISVVTTYEGAGPEEIETLITRPMEQSLATVEGIDRIESFSTEGRSRVALRFVWGTDLDSALNDVRAVVERIKSGLPEDVDNPVVYKFNLGSFPIVYAGLSGQMEEADLRALAERELVPRLERVEGVAAANLRGGLKREIHILLDSDRMRALSVAPGQIVQVLRGGNRNIPAGQVEQFDQNVLIRSVGEAESAEDFQDVVVAIRDEWDGTKYPVYLRDVATVVDTFEEPSNMVYINGQPGIRLAINKQSGSNTVEVSDRVQREFERINRDYQGQARIDVITDTADYIENSISNVQNSVLIGAALAVLVLLLFLRNVRSTLIISIGIPISVIGIFTLMYYFEITLNLISFGGVALGIGMLVDNAIVILENIFRKLEEGDDPFVAATEGAREVAGAIVASTMTTLVVFIPVIFLTGFASIFFGQMAFVVSFALICSLAVALTLIPVLSSRFLKQGAAMSDDRGVVGGGLKKLESAYGWFVDWCLDHPKSTILASLVMFAASFALVPFIGTELLPAGDESEVDIRVEMPVGTRIEVTDAAIRQLEAIAVQEVPELEAMQTVVGTPGFWSQSGEEAGSIELSLVKPTQRERSSEDIAQALRPKVEGLIPGADVRVSAGGGLWILRVLRGGGERLEVQVRGYDLDTADRLAGEVKTVMEDIEGVSGARASRQPGGKEVRIVPDRKKIAGLGLQYEDVATQVQTYIQGTRATVLRESGDEYDVLVKMRDDEVQNLDAMLDLPIVIPGVGTTPLRNVAEIQEVEGPLTIERLNQRRVVTVSAILEGTRDLGSIAQEIRERVRDLDAPNDFSIIVTGETEEQNKTFMGLVLGLVLALLLVYMVMAGQFESFLQPFLIMLSIPFAAIGVFAALAATQTTFNIQSFMGCIVLIGIVVNNAIVLIDYINLMRRQEGMGVREAVALSARRRLRPILMTSLTTMLALFPVALGFAEGGETQAPLARVVIGGMLTASAISLVIIPVLYNVIEGWREQRAEVLPAE